MINKKFCITMSGFVIASLMLTGCSSMFGNPMKYVISQDETRQEQTESQNDTGNNDTSSDEQISPEEDNDNQGGQHHQGLVPAYSVSGMLKTVKEINENIDDDKTKGIILIGEEQYIDYISYFISLTVEDKKPLVIIKNLNDDTEQAALISQVKSYINGEAESLPQDCIVNKNVSDVFDISSVKALPDVDIFYDYIGANTDELSKKIYISNGMVIIPSTSGADISSETYEIISQKNIASVVITCSKDILDTKIKDNSADNIYYTDLEPYKARLMLMFLLNKNSDSDSIKNALIND